MDRENDYIDADGYRANVGIVLMNDERQVFIGGRIGARGWQFPQGGIRRGERPEDALYRELTEEVGLHPEQVEVIARTRSWLRYRLPPQFVRRESKPLCIGQKQRWYLLKLGVGDSALRFDATEQPPEFVGELRDYQRAGLGWLNFLNEFRLGGCLADDMGLGKTIQVLALLEERRQRPAPKGQPRRPSQRPEPGRRSLRCGGTGARARRTR